MDAGLLEVTIAAAITVIANGAGAVPLILVKKFPDLWARAGWAASGGLMLAASVFNLIIPGVEDGGLLPVTLGMFLGAGMLALVSFWVSQHDYEFGGLTGAAARRTLLILATLFAHSFPEGLAVGVAYGSGEARLGLLVAIAIAIHNIPEGMAAAIPLRAEGVGAWRTMGWALLSGAPQLVAAVPAYLAVRTFRAILPYGFGFAAGAMFYLVLLEMIPESRATEAQRRWSAGAGMIGFLAMMLFQNLLVF